MMRWTKVSAIFDEPPSDWSIPAETFGRHGCEGTEQTDRPPALCGYVARVPGWEPRVEALSADLRLLDARVETSTVVEEDWAESWKAHFPPMRIGRRWIVRPTWETVAVGESDLEIVLDPGQAFGTGDHPTTRMCLQLLEEAPIEGKRVLDVGCGSGILSIASAKLGAARVLAVDIEPAAVEVARINAERNEARVECLSQDALGEEPGEAGWEVILSNIISATLIRIAPAVRAHLAPGGLWLVSGVIRANWDDVRSSAERVGMTLEKHLEEGEWVAAQFRG